MSSPVSDLAVKAPVSARDGRLGIPTYVYAVVFSSLCIVWGLLWDTMWHMSIGRDGLFSPPHLLIYVGAIVSGLFSGYQVLRLTFLKTAPVRAESVRFWGVFYGSLGPCTACGERLRCLPRPRSMTGDTTPTASTCIF